MQILVRFDDICPTMNFEQFGRAMEVLDKYNIKPLIGVIPDCCDPELTIDNPKDDYWSFLKQLQSKGYTIAMHGYQHSYTSSKRGLVNRGLMSEFVGCSLEEQLKKIKKGKDILSTHGIDTDIFFAPSHSYDENTVRALSACGFKYMSDGKSKRPYLWHGIKFLPCRGGGKLASMSRYNTAVFHAHEWVRPEKAKGYFDLKTLIENKNEQIVSFQEYANNKEGLFIIEMLNEKIFVFFERYLYSMVSKVYMIVRNLFQ